MTNWRSRPELTPAQQFQFLMRNPICAGVGHLGAAGLTWTYTVRPTVLSREYTAEIRFKRGDMPDVFIRKPNLELLAEGRPLPHIYRNPTRLCLYLPRANEWCGSMRIDQTFVPWTATWLFYFEEWLASDDWKGGGEHPTADDGDRYSRRVRRAVR